MGCKALNAWGSYRTENIEKSRVKKNWKRSSPPEVIGDVVDVEDQSLSRASLFKTLEVLESGAKQILSIS